MCVFRCNREKLRGQLTESTDRGLLGVGWGVSQQAFAWAMAPANPAPIASKLPWRLSFRMTQGPVSVFYQPTTPRHTKQIGLAVSTWFMWPCVSFISVIRLLQLELGTRATWCCDGVANKYSSYCSIAMTDRNQVPVVHISWNRKCKMNLRKARQCERHLSFIYFIVFFCPVATGRLQILFFLIHSFYINNNLFNNF